MGLIAINFLVFVCFLPIVLLLFLTRNNVYASLFFVLVFLLVCLGAVVIFLWVHLGLIFAIKDREAHIGVRQSLLRAWPVFAPYAWVSLLVGVTVALGFILLIIPGVIFAIWFVFSKFVVIKEGKKGTLAMAESKKLVAGNWWGIFLRFLVIGILTGILSYIPLLGSLINMFFTMPFITIYSYLMYEDLRRIKG